MSKLRERFEAWADVEFDDFSRHVENPEVYRAYDIQCAWEAYQSALEPVREFDCEKLARAIQEELKLHVSCWPVIEKKIRKELAKLLED